VEEIESFLIQMEAQYESVGDDVWVVKNEGADIVLSIAGPVLVFRVKVMELEKVPGERREELFRRLLEMNASEMLHGAYGLEGGAIVVSSALQLENLDYNEFQAVIDDLGLAVTNHYSTLASLAA
jgi:hypothetical protein